MSTNRLSSSLSRPVARFAVAAVLSIAGPSVLPAAEAVVAPTGANPARPSSLGAVAFANSGSPRVQEHFLRGLAALHSFWYEEAIVQFQAATALEPDFAMGYWGEALSYNHSLWGRQDQEFARKTLAKIKDTSHLTARERAYIEAARILYGEGDKLTRDIAYSKALGKIHADYPDDLDAAAFHALSILGTVRPGDKGYERQLKAAAIAEEVARRNPLHPGATHYIIHAYDHPDYAARGLSAARHYAEIAPEAFHAQHMPAHIFVQLGMWNESDRSNSNAWRVSDEWVARKRLPLGLRDYHSYHWLVYTRLQEGRYREATELLETVRRVIAENGPDSVNFYDQISAIYVVETEQWNRAGELLQRPALTGTPRVAPVLSEVCGGQSTLRRDTQQNNTELPVVIRAYAATAAGEAEAGRLRDAARAVAVEPGDAYGQAVLKIRLLQIDGLKLAARNDFDAALAALAEAASLEAATAKPSGPPRLIKPSHELYGEILLRAGRPAEAVHQFEIALGRQPGRAHALLGLARAKARAGDLAGAGTAYTAFLDKWQGADRDRPELTEARAFLQAHGAAVALAGN